MEKPVFTLAYPGEKLLNDGQPAKTENGLMKKLQGTDTKYSSGEDLFRAESYNDGDESPSLADLSSNTQSPESAPKSHKKHTKKRTRSKDNKDAIDQTVFPVRTPDKDGFLGPLSDLLEEDSQLPDEDECRDSPATERKKWAYLNRSFSTSSGNSMVSSSSMAKVTFYLADVIFL